MATPMKDIITRAAEKKLAQSVFQAKQDRAAIPELDPSTVGPRLVEAGKQAAVGAVDLTEKLLKPGGAPILKNLDQAEAVAQIATGLKEWLVNLPDSIQRGITPLFAAGFASPGVQREAQEEIIRDPEKTAMGALDVAALTALGIPGKKPPAVAEAPKPAPPPRPPTPPAPEAVPRAAPPAPATPPPAATKPPVTPKTKAKPKPRPILPQSKAKPKLVLTKPKPHRRPKSSKPPILKDDVATIFSEVKSRGGSWVPIQDVRDALKGRGWSRARQDRAIKAARRTMKLDAYIGDHKDLSQGAGGGYLEEASGIPYLYFSAEPGAGKAAATKALAKPKAKPKPAARRRVKKKP